MPNAHRAFRRSETRFRRFDFIDVCHCIWPHSVLFHTAEALVVARDALVDVTGMALKITDDRDAGHRVVLRIQKIEVPSDHSRRPFARGRYDLHDANGVGRRNRTHVESRFNIGMCEGELGIYSHFRGRAANDLLHLRARGGLDSLEGGLVGIRRRIGRIGVGVVKEGFRNRIIRCCRNGCGRCRNRQASARIDATRIGYVVGLDDRGDGGPVLTSDRIEGLAGFDGVCPIRLSCRLCCRLRIRLAGNGDLLPGVDASGVCDSVGLRDGAHRGSVLAGDAAERFSALNRVGGGA